MSTEMFTRSVNTAVAPATRRSRSRSDGASRSLVEHA
jgi:hypothetical protein